MSDLEPIDPVIQHLLNGAMFSRKHRGLVLDDLLDVVIRAGVHGANVDTLLARLNAPDLRTLAAQTIYALQLTRIYLERQKTDVTLDQILGVAREKR